MYLKRIKELREDHDYLQKEIAKELKCNNNNIANMKVVKE